MRRRISAQSCASVPPASDWIVTTASPESYSPEKSASSCRRASSVRAWALLTLYPAPAQAGVFPAVCGFGARARCRVGPPPGGGRPPCPNRLSPVGCRYRGGACRGLVLVMEVPVRRLRLLLREL